MFACILGLTTSESLRWVTSEHDKIVHFMAFFTESLLFVELFPLQILRCQLKGWSVPEGLKFRSKLVSIEQAVDLGSARRKNYVIVIDKYFFAVVVCVMSASIGSEFVQMLLTGGKRTFDMFDMATNITGSSLGVTLAYFIDKSK